MEKEAHVKFNAVNLIAIQRKRVANAIPPFRPPVPVTAPAHAAHWPAWHAFLTYEQGNPQRLPAATLRRRVLSSFKNASLACYHLPQFWHAYAAYVHATTPSRGTSSPDDENPPELADAVSVWQQAMSAMPYSVLLRLMYADFLEAHRRFPQAKAVYEAMTATESPPAVKHEGKQENNTNETLEPSSSQPLAMPPSPPLAWIHYLFFLRRTEGTAIARKAFVAARHACPGNWHIYIAAAQIERYANATPHLATRILDAGSKLYPLAAGLSLTLLDHLLHTSDAANYKATCERLLADHEAAAQSDPAVLGANETYVEVWARYLQLHRLLCEPLSAVLHLLHRRAAALGTHADITALEAAETAPVKPVTTRDMAPADLARYRAEQLLSVAETPAAGPARGMHMSDAMERYVFMDLLPCTAACREVLLGSSSRSNASSAAGTRTETRGGILPPRPPAGILRKTQSKQTAEALRARMTVPDLARMTAYTPQLAKHFSFHALHAAAASAAVTTNTAPSGPGIEPVDPTFARAPPLSISAYASEAAKDGKVAAPGHPGTALKVSPLLNALLLALHNTVLPKLTGGDADDDTDTNTGSGTPQAPSAVLTSPSTPYAHHYQGPHFAPALVMDALAQLPVPPPVPHTMHTGPAVDARNAVVQKLSNDRFKEVQLLFPYVPPRKDVKRRRDDGDTDSDSEDEYIIKYRRV
jgi:hypothetical protein